MTTAVDAPHVEEPSSKARRSRFCSSFLKLGVTCFGGPIAHIGYFRDEFVVRRRWLDEQAYADLVALCQFLPGPASSQVGFSIGLMRAGYLGGLAAWTGFTLPSAIALVLFALWRGRARRPGRQRAAAWPQARRRRDRRAGGMGHGAHALPRPGARVDRGRGGADHSVQHLLDRPDRGDSAGRHRWAVALPRRAAAGGRACRPCRSRARAGSRR